MTGNKNVFKYAIEIMEKNPNIRDYYYTCFYKISYNNFNNYKLCIDKLIKDSSILNNPESLGLEQEFPEVLLKIDKNCIQNIDTLGIYQIISVWKTNPNINYNI